MCVCYWAGETDLVSFPPPGRWPVSPTWPPRPGTRPQWNTCWSDGRTKTRGWTPHGGRITEFICPSRTKTSRITSLWVSPVDEEERWWSLNPALGSCNDVGNKTVSVVLKILRDRVVWWSDEELFLLHWSGLFSYNSTKTHKHDNSNVVTMTIRVYRTLRGWEQSWWRL